jgi:hypothetical protein
MQKVRLQPLQPLQPSTSSTIPLRPHQGALCVPPVRDRVSILRSGQLREPLKIALARRWHIPRLHDRPSWGSGRAALVAMVLGGSTTFLLTIFDMPLQFGLDANIFGITASAIGFIITSRINASPTQEDHQLKHATDHDRSLQRTT